MECSYKFSNLIQVLLSRFLFFKTSSIAVKLCQKTLESLKIADAEDEEEDISSRKRIYDLLEHVKNSFVPE